MLIIALVTMVLVLWHLVPFSLAVMGVQGSMLVLYATSSPLSWNIGNYPCSSVLTIFESTEAGPSSLVFQNVTDGHVLDVLSTSFIFKSKNSFKLSWYILNRGKDAYFMMKVKSWTWIHTFPPVLTWLNLNSFSWCRAYLVDIHLWKFPLIFKTS